jgi:hypothetical protein
MCVQQPGEFVVTLPGAYHCGFNQGLLYIQRPHPTTCVSSHNYIRMLILLHMCAHAAIYVSSYCSICVLILLYMCPHTTVYVCSYCSMCVLILPYMCTHTAIYVSSTSTCVSSHSYIRVLILLHMWRRCRAPITAAYTYLASSYYYTSIALILLYVCPHTTLYLASSYCYICVRIQLILRRLLRRLQEEACVEACVVLVVCGHIVAGVQLGTCLLDPTRLAQMWGSYETTYLSSYC